MPGCCAYIGNLFKYKTKTRNKTNLMVFLRPYVLRDAKSANQLTGERYDYIRNEQAGYVRENESLLPPNTAPLLPLSPKDASAVPAASTTAPTK